MKLGRLLSLAVVAAGLVVIGSESRAASITLPTTANNLAGNSVLFGPPSTTFAFTGVTPTNTTLSGIVVNPLSPVGTASNTTATPPFGFQLAGSVVGASGSGVSSDLLITYTATTTGPNFVSMTLFATGSFTGTGSASIGETIINGNTNLVEGSFNLSGGGQVTFVLPTPTNNLLVSKDINALSGTNGSGSYSDVRNVINITIPEPASVVMLGCGLVGVLGIGLRRTKKTA